MASASVLELSAARSNAVVTQAPKTADQQRGQRGQSPSAPAHGQRLRVAVDVDEGVFWGYD